MRYSLWLFVLFAMITLPLVTPFISQMDFARFRRQGVIGDGLDDRSMMESTYTGELLEDSGSLPSEGAAKVDVSREMDVSLINPISVAYFIWLAVMLFMLCITVFAYVKLRKLRTCSADVKDSAALEMFSQLKRRIGVKKSVALRASSEIYTPMSLGVFSSVIIVPDSIMNDGSRDELEMILAHELAHIRRYDYLVNFLQNTMRAIFFFHPLFHLMNRSLIKEREHICDDWVIDVTKQRKQYARCIVSLLERVVYRPATFPV
jgi:beta-lactamase regulating signal transducer with metallopeptidase domain